VDFFVKYWRKTIVLKIPTISIGTLQQITWKTNRRTISTVESRMLTLRMDTKITLTDSFSISVKFESLGTWIRTR
jgi:hypothetical protein